MEVHSTKYVVRSFNSRGQALVLVLLSLSVVLTMVLFVMARSVTDVAVSTSSEASVRAFSAAEAGGERALVVGTASSNVSVGDAKYTSVVGNLARGLTSYNYPVPLSSGDSMTTWFVSHDPVNGNLSPTCNTSTLPCFRGTSMTVCWGKPGLLSATTPAIEVSVFYKTTAALSSIRIGRVTADPYANRRTTNRFGANTTTGGACTISGVTYAFKKTFTFTSIGATMSGTAGRLQFAQVRMFYNTDQAHPVGISVAGGTTLPSQGLDIASTGTAGGANRKVAVFQSWPEVPSVFDYAVYSGSTTGLIK